MELQELEDLVHKGEGQLLEFKLKASFPEKIVKEMVAFANSNGGQLLVGVDDDGRIAGLKFAEEENPQSRAISVIDSCGCICNRVAAFSNRSRLINV